MEHIIATTAQWDFLKKGKNVDMFFSLLEKRLEGRLYFYPPPELKGKVPKYILVDNIRVVY